MRRLIEVGAVYNRDAQQLTRSNDRMGSGRSLPTISRVAVLQPVLPSQFAHTHHLSPPSASSRVRPTTFPQSHSTVVGWPFRGLTAKSCANHFGTLPVRYHCLAFFGCLQRLRTMRASLCTTRLRRFGCFHCTAFRRAASRATSAVADHRVVAPLLPQSFAQVGITIGCTPRDQ